MYLQCQWQSNKNQGHESPWVYKSHFMTKSMVLEKYWCVGDTVVLSGINIGPEVGLYNGAQGTLINFVYNNV